MFATMQLREEHKGIKKMLRTLERLTMELVAGQQISLAHLEQILDFFRVFVDKCHHYKEEQLLFPALTAFGVTVERGPVGLMLMEHDEGRILLHAMSDALEKIKLGEVDASQMFVSNALSYIHLLCEHIEKEDRALFSIAEQVLPSTESQRLIDGFNRVEAEELGEGVHEKYHQLIDELVEAYLAGIGELETICAG